MIRRLRSRRALLVTGIVVTVAAVLAGVAVATSGSDDDSGRPLIITAEAQRRTLKDSVTVKGTAGRVEQREIQAAGPAQVTDVPIEDGAEVAAGSALLSLDGRAAIAAMGDIPFFRSLDVGSRGEDVRQLETILDRAGYHPGTVDDVYTESTRTALAQWQAAYHYPGATPEHEETVTVNLSPSNGYKVGDRSSAGVTIQPIGVRARSSGDGIVVHTASTANPVLSIHSLSAVAGEGTTATFRIDADDVPTADTLVTVSLAGVSSSDALAPAGTITLKAGEWSTTVSIPIRQDNAVEGDETMTVSVVDDTTYDVSALAASASTVIVDDDVPELSISGGGSVPEGSDTTLVIAADQAPVKDIQVPLSISGDAQPGEDYRVINTYAVLRKGTTSVEVPVSTRTDSIIESNERIIVALTPNASQYRTGPASQAVVTISRDVGDLALPVLELHGSARKLDEGQPLALTVTLNQPLTESIQLQIGYSGSARQGEDFARLGRIDVPAGQTSIPLQVGTVEDQQVEPDHDLVVSLLPSGVYRLGDPTSWTATIVSDDIPKLSLLSNADSVREGRGTSFRIVADQAPVKDISVSYSVVGSATPGQDFDALTGTALMPAGQTSIEVPLLTLADDVVFQPTDMIAGHWPTRVGQVLVDEGDTVTAGMPLLSLTDSGLTVTLHATASDRTRLRTGQKVTVTVTGSSDEAEGVITKLDDNAQIDEKTKEQFYEGTVNVRDLDAADGANVSIEVILDERNDVLTVPIAAVKQNGDGDDVVRVLDLDDGGATKEVAVKTGISEGSYIEIESGLSGGEVVIVEVDTDK
jgi:multidrug efflux pump subunit AcrA (membrane-fusion protein)